MNRAQSLLFETAAVLKAKPAELREKAEQNMAELREMRHTVEKFQAREAAGETERFLMGGHDLGELKVLTATLPNADAAKMCIRDSSSPLPGSRPCSWPACCRPCSSFWAPSCRKSG